MKPAAQLRSVAPALDPTDRYSLIAYVSGSSIEMQRPMPTLTFADIYTRSGGARAVAAMAAGGQFYVFDLHDVMMLGDAPFVGPGKWERLPTRDAALNLALSWEKPNEGETRMTIKAYRSGESRINWSKDPYDEVLRSGKGKIRFYFRMPSKGGGVTFVQLQVSSESFEHVAKAMVESNDDAAILAFVTAGNFGLLAAAMMEADEDRAIAAFATALNHSEDRTIKACSDILHQGRDSLTAPK